MAKMGLARSIAMIDHTIAMGWQGLREPERRQDGKAKKNEDVSNLSLSHKDVWLGLKDFEKKDHVTYYENGKRYLEMLAKPTEKYPYLSMVIFLFESTEDLKSQVTKFVPKAWFMF